MDFETNEFPISLSYSLFGLVICIFLDSLIARTKVNKEGTYLGFAQRKAQENANFAHHKNFVKNGDEEQNKWESNYQHL